MTRLTELWNQFHLLSDPTEFSPEELTLLCRFLEREAALSNAKRISSLLARPGIKRVKTFGEFDWMFNAKVPREKLLEFMAHPWLKLPCNLVVIGPAGFGKTHLAQALCHDAVMNGHQTLFLSLFDLMAKLSKAKSLLCCYRFLRQGANTSPPVQP